MRQLSDDQDEFAKRILVSFSASTARLIHEFNNENYKLWECDLVFESEGMCAVYLGDCYNNVWNFLVWKKI